MIQLTTPRLLIRDHREDDLGSYHELLSNPTVMFRHSETSQTLEQSKERLRKSIEQINLPQRELYYFCIENRFTSEFVGEIGYGVTKFTPFGKLAGVGYFIHDKHWSRGYTTEALQEVIRFAFEEDNMYRFEAGCLKENVGSERVMQKCGFVKEADFKEYQWHDGQLKDRVVYRLLRSEWLQNR
jgi:ribosomal-protein-alanine N-acetyltransferase